jgi:GAF domain-containing protein
MARPSGTGSKTSEAKTRKSSPAKGRKTAMTKRRIAPAAVRVKRRSVSGPSKDLKEARAQQAATAEILKVIASSPSDVQPVFEAIAMSANRLIGGFSCAVFRFVDGLQHLAAFTSTEPASDQALKASFPRPMVENSIYDLISHGAAVQITDTEAADEFSRRLGRTRGFRSISFTPLTSSGTVIGMITVTRKEPGPFADHHVQLLLTFADQAVIAIENVRLFEEVQARTRDLTESLEQQTATSEVLGVISRSLGQVEPVFQSMLANAMRLCEAQCGAMFSYAKGAFRAVSCLGVAPSFETFLREERVWGRETGMGRAARTKQPVHVVDTVTDRAYADRDPDRLVSVEIGGVRTFVIVPMLKDGELIGAMSLYRRDVRAYTDKQIKLVSTFADQAVIAIENTRLFEEVQARTRELQEALVHQTGSANILRVIASSQTDIEPVLKAIVDNACEICEAVDAVVYLKDEDHLKARAHRGPIPIPAESVRLPINRRWATGRSFVDKVPVHIHDLHSPEGDEFPDAQRHSALMGHRAVLAVPLLRESESIGSIVLRRTEVQPFSDKQIALLQTFADQAVIAIGNVRMFEQVQAKTRDLAESLEQQTATSEVLRVISSSPGELGPVFEQMLEKATRVCGASFGTLNLFDGERFETVALYNVPPAFAASRKRALISPHPEGGLSYVARTKQVAHIHDLRLSPAYRDGSPAVIEFADAGGARTVIIVPMVKENELTGTITIYRKEVRPFTEKQIELVANFAKQAVIAIENTRLLKELRQRTEDLSESLQQQTATADVLKVISASPGELEPVFQAMLENAVRLCEAQFAMLFLYEKEKNEYRAVGRWNLPPAWGEFLGKNPFPAHPKVPLGRIAITKQPVQIADVLADQAYIERHAGMVAVVELGGARTLLQVPMLKENELVGAFGIYRQEVRPFTDKQVALVQNFAAQAVIAIENARLLNELRQRTDDLTRSLEDLRTAQDRLIQTEKLASLGQLTAGIAHEIKNPLNFVNNFAALSVELTDELKGALKPAMLDQTIRAEVDEITGLLKDNLGKVVQHGKRADSIVKNMLLHSREGSGERRSADINALVGESLNLAYHGARAEKPGFTITLKHDLDPNAGALDLYPQEITRALLNLISNGFYAAIRRKAEADDDTFEPVLSATTRDLGETVEIRIRDNGNGISPEVRVKIFNPFFTTKPTGEGTGLGLSMTHDIIVKQHGGRIDVDTEPGAFTEFIITLPRDNGTVASEKPE